MVIAIISDTHLPRRGRTLPGACVDRLSAADVILHAGDFSHEQVLGWLESLGPPVEAVRGNVESEGLRARLADTNVVEAHGKRIAMVHDAGPARGRLERLRRRFPDADAVVFGHSHLPLHEASNGFQIFNPGSPTERRRSLSHTMGLARVGRGAIAFEHVALD